MIDLLSLSLGLSNEVHLRLDHFIRAIPNSTLKMLNFLKLSARNDRVVGQAEGGEEGVSDGLREGGSVQ